MKKIFTFAMAALMCMSCATKKNVNQSNVSEQQPKTSTTSMQIEEMKQQQELVELKRKAELDSIKYEMEKNRLLAEGSLTEKLQDGQQVITVFCIDDAMDKEGEYMAGLGISQNQIDQKDALISANQVALSDINSRFLGVVKNGVEMYNKETNTRTREKGKESQLEGLAQSIGEKAINKFADVVCRKMTTEKTGTYAAYVAIHVPTGKVLESIADELEILKVDYDKNLFMQKMQDALNAQAEQQNKEIDAMIKQ